MTFRSTFILSACALSLFAFIYFFESRTPDPNIKAAIPRLIPGFDPSTITAVEITRTNALIRVQRTNDGWQLSSPSYPAQSTGIESLISESAAASKLGTVSAQEVQNDPGGFKSFGLDPARISVTFQTSTGRVHLKIGGNTPIGERIYVQIVGSPEVVVTDSKLLKHLPETANQWRDTRLVDIAPLQFDRVQVASGPRLFEIQRNPTNQQWRITRPLPGRADSNGVEQLLIRLQSAHVAKFVQDAPTLDLESFGLQTPAATLSLLSETNTLASIEFGRSPTNDQTKVFARSLVRSNVVLVSRDLLDFLQQPYKNFHDPHLLELQPGTVSTIQIRTGETFDLEKRDGKWMVAPGNFPADPGLVGEMLTNAANLEIVDFAKDVPTEADLKQYGLNLPSKQYTFLKLGTNLAGVATNVPIVRVDFGAAANPPDTIFAKRSDEVPVYRTATASVDELPVQSFQVRDRRLWNISPAAVTNLAFIFNDTTYMLPRAATGRWSTDDILNAAIEEIIFRITQIKTPRWVAKGNQKAAVFGLMNSSSSMTLGVVDPAQPRQISVVFGGRTPGRSPNVYASYIPEGESERLIFEFPGAIYQEILRLMTPNPK
jgi:hypothetical protein